MFTRNINISFQHEPPFGVGQAVLSFDLLSDREAVLRQVEDRVDRPRDDLFPVGVTRAGFLSANPVFEVAGFDVLRDRLAAAIPQVVADTRVSSRFPEFGSESGGEHVRGGTKHILVHSASCWIGRRSPWVSCVAAVRSSGSSCSGSR